MSFGRQQGVDIHVTSRRVTMEECGSARRVTRSRAARDAVDDEPLLAEAVGEWLRQVDLAAGRVSRNGKSTTPPPARTPTAAD